MKEIHNLSDAVKYYAFNFLCEHLNNKIKEVEFDKLGDAWDKVVSYNATITFEQYINSWKSRGYRIV